MPNSITEKIRFVGIKSKKVEANFTGGRIVSDGGVLLLRQADKRIRLSKDLSSAIKDKRHKSYVIHETNNILAQRIHGIACGYEDVNDQTKLRNDPIFKVANGRSINDGALASASTINRLENSITREELVNMSRVFVEKFISSYSKAPEILILDFDATDDKIHGNQEKRFFHGYYDSYCYLPLYVFCGSKLLVSYLRESKIDASKHSSAILKLLVKRFRRQWPEVKILVRADSGFCGPRLLSWCDRNGAHYITGISKNPVLTRLASQIIEETRMEKGAQSFEKIRKFAEIRYAAKTWKRRRRVIVKAEQLPKGENARYVVTNIEKYTPEFLYDEVYVKRGDMENRIKEQQLELFADRTSCSRFLANQFRLLLASSAYILMDYIRRIGLKNTKYARAQVGTIRLMLLKAGAFIDENSKRILMRISEVFVYKDIFSIVAARLL